MKKIILILLLVFSFTFLGGCANNGQDDTYKNTNEENILEDTYEDEMGNPEEQVGSITLGDYIASVI